jgi:hypothetical protein
MPEDSINNNLGMIPVLAQRIKKDIDAARTHLNSHVKRRNSNPRQEL